MSLTQDDLRAIKTIVEDVVEDSKLQTAAGFGEVHEKFTEVHEKFDLVFKELNEVKRTVHHIEAVQQAEIERVDYHEKSITRIRKMMRGV